MYLHIFLDFLNSREWYIEDTPIRAIDEQMEAFINGFKKRFTEDKNASIDIFNDWMFAARKEIVKELGYDIYFVFIEEEKKKYGKKKRKKK